MQHFFNRHGLRLGFVLAVFVGIVAFTAVAEEKADDTSNVRRRVVRRETIPLGGSIKKRLIGNRESIRKSPYPYAERSFSSRLKSVFSSMREQHEMAFRPMSGEPTSSTTNLVHGVETNRFTVAQPGQ